MADHVELAADVFMSCLTHALSTEREEVMGLLLGEVRKKELAVSLVPDVTPYLYVGWVYAFARCWRREGWPIFVPCT